MVNVLESRTCSGSLCVVPNKLGNPTPRPCEIQEFYILNRHLGRFKIGIDRRPGNGIHHLAPMATFLIAREIVLAMTEGGEPCMRSLPSDL